MRTETGDRVQLSTGHCLTYETGTRPPTTTPTETRRNPHRTSEPTATTVTPDLFEKPLTGSSTLVTPNTAAPPKHPAEPVFISATPTGPHRHHPGPVKPNAGLLTSPPVLRTAFVGERGSGPDSRRRVAEAFSPPLSPTPSTKPRAALSPPGRSVCRVKRRKPDMSNPDSAPVTGTSGRLRFPAAENARGCPSDALLNTPLVTTPRKTRGKRQHEPAYRSQKPDDGLKPTGTTTGVRDPDPQRGPC